MRGSRHVSRRVIYRDELGEGFRPIELLDYTTLLHIFIGAFSD